MIYQYETNKCNRTPNFSHCPQRGSTLTKATITMEAYLLCSFTLRNSMTWLHFLIKIQGLHGVAKLRSVNDVLVPAHIPQQDWRASGSVPYSPYFLLHTRQWNKYANPYYSRKDRILTGPKMNRDTKLNISLHDSWTSNQKPSTFSSQSLNASGIMPFDVKFKEASSLLFLHLNIQKPEKLKQLLFLLSLIQILDNLHIKPIFHQIFTVIHIYVPFPTFPISLWGKKIWSDGQLKQRS